MRKCIESLLVGGQDVEIIIVNDGSTDQTLAIAECYAEKYPEIVKVIDKENGGHGSGVNAGAKLATGLYYKVVDSDDWLNEDSLKLLLQKIKEHLAANTLPDLYIANFVYEHSADNTRHVSAYANKMPQGEIITWDKVKKFRYSHMLLMHALFYKREKLLESKTELPEHTFYVDNIFAYQPLPYMQTIYYLNADMYSYFIGRDDQSVNRKNFVQRYEQQIRVMLRMTDAYRWDEIKRMRKGLRNYMWHALQAIMMTTLLFVCAEDSPERRAALKEMWSHIKKNDKKLYAKLRRRSYAAAVNYLPWKLRGWIMVEGYNRLCKKVKLG